MYMYVCTCMYVCMCAYAVWFSKQPEAKRGIKKFLKRYVCMYAHTCIYVYMYMCTYALWFSKQLEAKRGTKFLKRYMYICTCTIQVHTCVHVCSLCMYTYVCTCIYGGTKKSLKRYVYSYIIYSVCTYIHVHVHNYALSFSKQPEAKRGTKFLKRYVHVYTYSTCTLYAHTCMYIYICMYM